MIEQNRFKEVLNEIPVPSAELDVILEDAFKKEKKLFRVPFKRMIKYTVAVGILSICTITSAYVSPAFANLVTQIPIIGYAFEHFILQEDYYQSYEEISTDIGLVAESNGVKLIIEQAFYDGNTVTLSYVLRTEEKLGTLPTFENLPTVEGNWNNAGYEVEFIEGVGYVGMMTVLNLENAKDTVNVVWEPNSISSDTKTIEGDWKFAFSLDALEGSHISINEQVSKDGVTVELIDAVRTDVNLTINYLQNVNPTVHNDWTSVEAELYAIDNLGNEYQVPYNGGTGTEGGDSSEDITWNATIHGLNPKATSITFYPFAHLSNNQNDSVKIDFDPVIVELD
jgi:hypothetical protein